MHILYILANRFFNEDQCVCVCMVLSLSDNARFKHVSTSKVVRVNLFDMPNPKKNSKLDIPS